MSIKAYKGFNKDMTCRGFKYEEGKSYKEEVAKCCNSGFHACENPIDVFNYYDPAHSIYREVELNGDTDKDPDDDDSNICAAEIKIGATIDLPGMIKASIDFVMNRVKRERSIDKDNSIVSLKSDNSCVKNSGYSSVASNSGYRSVATNSGDSSVASNSGYSSVASNSGYRSVATNSGYRSVATNSGDSSVATNSGYRSVATNSGDSSVATNSGDSSVATNSGYSSVASNSGYRSVATNSGDSSVASTTDGNSIAVAWGQDGKAKGVKGSYLVLSEWEYIGNGKYNQLGAEMVRVDGKEVKEDTYYMLKKGKVSEVE